jgi:hypothetical protein
VTALLKQVFARYHYQKQCDRKQPELVNKIRSRQVDALFIVGQLIINDESEQDRTGLLKNTRLMPQRPCHREARYDPLQRGVPAKLSTSAHRSAEAVLPGRELL